MTHKRWYNEIALLPNKIKREHFNKLLNVIKIGICQN